jgi:uncharacterized YigZ family protein
MSGYQIPAHSISTEIVIKKSRFIAQLHAVTNREQAMCYLEQAREKYPDARHHCWAYQIGEPNSPTSAAMSDDGEPSGTAGKPILNVIQHKGVGNVMVIVIRYFGGIKLGAGGLVRAYSGATQQAFEKASYNQQRDLYRQSIHCAFADEQRIRHELEVLGGKIINVDYSEKVSLVIEIEQSAISQLTAIAQSIPDCEIVKSTTP